MRRTARTTFDCFILVYSLVAVTSANGQQKAVENFDQDNATAPSLQGSIVFEMDGGHPLYIEAGPMANSTLYYDGSQVQVPTRITTSFSCFDRASGLTLADLKAAARQADLARNQGNSIIVNDRGTERGTGLNIVFSVSGAPPADVLDAIEASAQFVESQFADSLKVVLNFNWVFFDGLAFTQNVSTSTSYTSARTGLIADMDADDVIQSFLPSGSTLPVRFNGGATAVTHQRMINFTKDNFRATIGTLGGGNSSITMNSEISYDLDPSNGIAPNQISFQDVLVHEIGHALGFTSAVDRNAILGTTGMDAMDIFRFQRTNGSGNYNPETFSDFQTTPRTVDQNTPNDDANIDLIHVEYRMSDSVPNQADHFGEQTPLIGEMASHRANGETTFPDQFMDSDLSVLDAIGWDVVNGDCGVVAPVSITSQPIASDFACTGETTILAVAATGEGLAYEWQKDGVTLNNSCDITGADSAFLSISNLSLDDAANSPGYTCFVGDRCGNFEESTPSTLEIVGPDFSIQPQNTCVDTGQAAVFTTSVAPPAGLSLFVQWHKNGVPMLNSGNVSGVFTNTLTISPVSEGDEAGYSLRVLVIGPNCTEFSEPAQLRVDDCHLDTSDCGNATPIACGETRTFTLQDANAESLPITSSCEIAAGGPFPKDKSVWHEFTASSDSAEIELCTGDSEQNSVLTIFTADSDCESLTELSCNDDGCPNIINPQGRGAPSIIANGLVPGQTYLILVDFYAGEHDLPEDEIFDVRHTISVNCDSEPPQGACCNVNGLCNNVSNQAECDCQGGTYQGDGTACASVSCPQPSTNDECEGRIPLPCNQTTYADLANATGGTDDPIHACSTTTNPCSEYFEFIAIATSARIRTDLNSTEVDSVFTLYEVNQAAPCDESQWTIVGCSDDEGLGLLGDITVDNLIPGDTYILMITGFLTFRCDDGPYGIDVECPDVLPDILIEDIVIPTTLPIGKPVQVTWNLHNVGNEPAIGPWGDQLLLSEDEVLGDDLSLGLFAFEGEISADGIVEREATVTIPSDSAGTRFLLAVADAANSVVELDEINNLIIGRQLTIVGPDLITVDLESPETAELGELFTVNWITRNDGDGEAEAPWVERVLLSIDETLSPDDIELAEVDENISLSPNTEMQQSIEFAVPFDGSVLEGDYFVLVVSDVEDDVIETNELNNQSVPAAVTITEPPRPDLTVVSFSAPTSAITGTQILLEWTVQNDGQDIATGQWVDKVYLSGNSQLDAGDVLLDEFTFLGTIGVGDTYNQFFVVSLPEQTGQRFLLLAVDGNDNIEEPLGDANNLGVAPIELEQVPIPDLVVSSIMPPTSGVLSGSLTEVTFDVLNDGTGSTDVPFWMDGVFLSDDPTLDVGDLRVGFAPNPLFLPTGQSYRQTIEFELPSDRPGEFWLIAHTDYWGQVQEFSESNNTTTGGPFTVALEPQPDLQVTSVSGPALAFSGEPIAVSWTELNSTSLPGTGGTTDSGNWFVRVYLSTDQDLSVSPGDIQLGSLTSGSGSPLAAGESISMTNSLLLPAVISGDFFVKVESDSTDVISEFGFEGNNVNVSDSVVQITQTPPVDLVPTSVNYSGEALPGHVLDLTYEAVNFGAPRQTSIAWEDAVYLSDDAIFDASSDIRIATISRTAGPEGIDPYSQEISVRLDNSLVPGAYALFVRVDDTDSLFEGTTGESNNVIQSSADVIVEDRYADLQATLTAPASGAFSPGQDIDASWTVTNEGEAITPVNSWSDTILFSSDDIADDFDEVLASVNRIGVLPPSAGYSRQTNVTLPLTQSGFYSLILVSDRADSVFEGPSEIESNISVIPIELSNVAADLTVSNAIAPLQAEAGQSVQISWTVANDGSTETNRTTWFDRVDISRADLPEFVFASASVPHLGSLQPAETYDGTANVQIPINISGDLIASIRTDSLANVFEQNENNNTASTNVFTAKLPNVGSNANLVASSPDGPTEAQSGDTISVSWSVTNAGAGESSTSQWTDNIYLSSDETLSADDIILGSKTRYGVLPPAATYDVSINATIDPSIPLGDYYYFLKTDSNDAVFENDQLADNVAVSSGTLSVGPFLAPNLVALSVTSDSEVATGQILDVAWTVRNDGEGPTRETTWSDAVWLSRDQLLSSNDVRLGTLGRNVSLDVGQTYEQTASLRVPSGISGPFFVLVQVDIGDRVEESGSPSDNIIAGSSLIDVTIPEPADLIVTNVQVPSTAMLGEQATFTWEATNSPDASSAVSGSWEDSVFLSEDSTWDVDDAFIGQVTTRANTPLEPGDSVAGSITATVPGVRPGTYFIIVRADSRNLIPETNNANNDAASLNPASIAATTLTLGSPFVGDFPAGVDRYFALKVPAGATVQVVYSHDAPNAFTELYVKSGNIPTIGDFDALFTSPGASDQEIIIPSTIASTYYILARTSQASLNTGALVANLLPFSITNVSLSTLGQGRVTTMVHGAQFTPETAFFLESLIDGQQIQAQQQFVSPSTVLLTFNLENVASGEATLTAISEKNTDTLTGLQIVPPINAAYEFDILDGPAIRVGTQGRGTAILRVFGNTNVDFGRFSIGIAATPDTLLTTDVTENAILRASETALTIQVLERDIAPGFVRIIPFNIDIPIGYPYDAVQIFSQIELLGPHGFSESMLPGIVEPIRQGLLADSTVDPLVQLVLQEQALVIQELQDEYLRSGFVELSNPSRETINISHSLDISCQSVCEAGFRLATLANEIKKLIRKRLRTEGILPDVIDGALETVDDAVEQLIQEICSKFCNDPCSVVDPLNVVGCYDAFPPEPQCDMEICYLDTYLRELFIEIPSPTGHFPETMIISIGHVPDVREICIPPDATKCRPTPQAIDPNELIGPQGARDQKWVSASEALEYRALFENLPIATAPAARVSMTISLSNTISTGGVRLSNIGFGDLILDVPNNRITVQDTVFTESPQGTPLRIDIAGGVNPTLSPPIAFWVLQAIETMTGEPPLDAFDGFLPPNDPETGSGEGFIDFSLRPAPGVVTGDVIELQAEIIFDNEEPILTNTVFNTIDADPPISMFEALPAATLNPEIPLSFSGFDPAGSGLLGVQVFVSENNGPPAVFVPTTQEAAAIFEGEAGNVYRFVSQAIDSAGNVENLATAPNTVVVIPTLELAIESDTGILGDGLTTDPTPTFEIVSVPFAQIPITISGPESLNATIFTDAIGRGTYTVPGTSALSDGDYTVSTDNSGVLIDLPIQIAAAAVAGGWDSIVDHGGPGELAIPVISDETTTDSRAGSISQLHVSFSAALDVASFTPAAVSVVGLDINDDPVDLGGLTTDTSVGGTEDVGIITFSPPLPDKARYCISINGVRDSAGNTIAVGTRIDLIKLVGDVTGDGRVNATDLAFIRNIRASLGTSLIDPSNPLHVRADVTGDGRVNATDIAFTRASNGTDARAIPDPCPVPSKSTNEQDLSEQLNMAPIRR
ncbi:MAG TPA: NF038122 family metalloprotease [Phycisphaerae bacterium]|nr:NF038122 family metalloprotease [Phycisphaerae bacterium]